MSETESVGTGSSEFAANAPAPFGSMNPMIVRCGRCRSELEIPGAGEFVCPACGTRNVARGGAAQASPYTIGASPTPGLTIPGGAPPQPGPSEPLPSANWAECPACAFRFAIGEVSQLTCPNCRVELDRSPDGALTRTAG